MNYDWKLINLNIITMINSKQLQKDHQYWYITVPYCCHWSKIKIKKIKYTGNYSSVSENVIFDNEADAQKCLDKIKKSISSNLIP